MLCRLAGFFAVLGMNMSQHPSHTGIIITFALCMKYMYMYIVDGIPQPIASIRPGGTIGEDFPFPETWS